eukprot:3065753-Prymnesium_polylepis.2
MPIARDRRLTRAKAGPTRDRTRAVPAAARTRMRILYLDRCQTQSRAFHAVSRGERTAAMRRATMARSAHRLVRKALAFSIIMSIAPDFAESGRAEGKVRSFHGRLKNTAVSFGVAPNVSESYDTAVDASSSRRRLAMMTVLSDGHYMERDREAISLMTCFAIQHNIPYYIETHMFGSNWYNKQLALRKYMSAYDWIFYVDADTYIMNRLNGRKQLMAYISMLEEGGYHMAFSELHHSGVGGFDAGV